MEAEKITSSRQQVRQQVLLRERQEQQQVREQQQVLQQQVREQQQERELLFCHRRPEQRPTELPRGVIFSWGYFL